MKYILKTLLGAGSRSRLTKGQTTAISDEFMTKVAEATNEAMDAGMPADIAARKLLYVVAGLAQGGMSSGKITIVNTDTGKVLGKDYRSPLRPTGLNGGNGSFRI